VLHREEQTILILGIGWLCFCLVRGCAARMVKVRHRPQQAAKVTPAMWRVGGGHGKDSADH